MACAIIFLQQLYQLYYIAATVVMTSEFSPPSSDEASKPIGRPVRFRNVASRGIADSASPACFFLLQVEQTSSEPSLVRLRALCYVRFLHRASHVCSP